MISNWVKEMGIEAGCEMCLITEIANDRLTKEVMEGKELAVELVQERARYRDQARHWKNVAGIALVALAGVFVLVVAGRIK